MENKKKFILMYIAVLSVIIIVIGTSSFYAKSKDSVNIETKISAVYTCPMHPEIISDVPGDCPKCGMALVLKDETKPNDDTKQAGDGCCGEKMSMDGCGKMSGHDHNKDHSNNVDKDQNKVEDQKTGNDSQHKGCMGH